MRHSKRYIPPERPYQELLEVAINALKAARKRIRTLLGDGTGLEQPQYTAPDGSSQKMMLEVDKAAENECAQYFVHAFGEKQIRVLGEETLWRFENLDLRTQRLEGYGKDTHLVEVPETRITAIIDMIDGSDLVERNLGNWCSAMIVFKPGDKPMILFSLVQNADDVIYGADEKGTFILPAKVQKGDLLHPLRGPDIRRTKASRGKTPKSIANTAQIAVCYYGQKYNHFTSVPHGIMKWAKNTPAQKRLRFYDLAGNPMMARLANGENIHVVFEHIGQYPHDAAPGAYIAKKAGADVVDFSGSPITYDDLSSYLMKPSGARLRYVVASTKELGSEIVAYLQRGQLYFECVQGCNLGRVALSSGPPLACELCGGKMQPRERRLR
jgi:fructose-1,6-bisphosphatase/inositol monophosphatase family enzyme